MGWTVLGPTFDILGEQKTHCFAPPCCTKANQDERFTSPAGSGPIPVGDCMAASHVALVDDDRNILTSVSMTLEAEGFEVETYSDGQ